MSIRWRNNCARSMTPHFTHVRRLMSNSLLTLQSCSAAPSSVHLGQWKVHKNRSQNWNIYWLCRKFSNIFHPLAAKLISSSRPIRARWLSSQLHSHFWRILRIELLIDRDTPTHVGCSIITRCKRPWVDESRFTRAAVIRRGMSGIWNGKKLILCVERVRI